MKEKIKTELEGLAQDKSISCAEAWKLAEDLNVSKAEVGQEADKLKIKIHSCQLGCF